MNKMHYGRLVPMVVLPFVSMYVLMYAMVDTFANVYGNLNQFNMAGLMTARPRGAPPAQVRLA
jgi:hypothetical protein